MTERKTASKTLNEGVYKGKVVSQRFGAVENESKTPYLEVEFVVTHKQLPDYTFEPLPRATTRHCTMYLTEATMEAGLVIKQLRGIGWNGTDFEELEPESKKFVSLEGNECEFLCKHETNKGKTFEAWQVFVRDSKPKERKPSDTSVSKKLNALFGNKLKSSAPASKPANTSKKPTTPKQEDEETTSADEELTF